MTALQERKREDAGLLVDRTKLAFTLDRGIAHRAAIGLIVLATDHTIEYEWRRMLSQDGIAFYESRIMNSSTITPETLAAMEQDLTEATAVIRPGQHLDVIAYGCTSGAMVIGEEKVWQRIRQARPGIACTSPITAAVAGLQALGARRVALLTPYIARINHMMRDFLQERGLAVPVMGSYNHENDDEVARISGESIRSAVAELGRHEAVDAVFVACTSLRVAEHVAALEAALGKPVTSSNHAMAWHALRLAGVKDTLPGLGRLFHV
ncbi:MAG: aspartate/glutamate racemase family protein [Proteobacteria bacterium]|nr:aspartate/glutamate racemase family protein [Pseudomonadota bacterium]MBI3496165.1 aspartate/glutamate racemase family protein [Pseudomonadota bacterium]